MNSKKTTMSTKERLERKTMIDLLSTESKTLSVIVKARNIKSRTQFTQIYGLFFTRAWKLQSMFPSIKGYDDSRLRTLIKIALKETQSQVLLSAFQEFKMDNYFSWI